MIGKSSPKLNLMQVSIMKKKRASPKAGGKGAVERSRASWNLGLEKALVELLLDHNNDHYRGQNGWSTDAWNRIVRLFYDKFKHVSFSKQQIQDKEKELKREYRMLKEARKQSGASWNDKLCMIEADEPVWDNIITSFPKAKKFKSKPFPLFETLGELYDGHTAEGSLNMTSLPEPTPSEPSITHISGGDGFEDEEFESTQVLLHDVDDEDDEDVRILEQPSRPTAARFSSHEGHAVPVPDVGKKVQKRQKEADVVDGRKNVPKKQKKEDVSHIISQYLKVKTKLVECEAEEKAKAAEEKAAEEKAKAGSGAVDYSITKCVSVINTMEELNGEEKANAVDVFKDAQNREIFMGLDLATRLIWIRKKSMQTGN